MGPLSYDWPDGIERRNWDIRELLRDHTPTLSQLAGTLDLLAGGPPCQGFSHAGYRRPDDPRNRLFEAYLDLVRILRPRLVLVENVRGFTSDFKASQPKLVENFANALREGLSTDYELASSVIRASDYGVPQVRPRFILIGALKAMAASERVHAFFDDLARKRAGFLTERGLPLDPTSKDALSDLEVARNGTVPSRDSPGFDEIDYSSPITPYQRAMRDGHNGPAPRHTAGAPPPGHTRPVRRAYHGCRRRRPPTQHDFCRDQKSTRDKESRPKDTGPPESGTDHNKPPGRPPALLGAPHPHCARERAAAIVPGLVRIQGEVHDRREAAPY